MFSRPVAYHDFTASMVAITGAGAACALGQNLPECHAMLHAGQSGLRPLGESGLVIPEKFQSLLAGWIPDRSYLKGRRYGAASNAAVHAAREAISAAGWDAAEAHETWLWVGTSRGNVGELAGAWSSRRPVRKFAASNTMHSEIAAAISIQLGIHGPWQVISNGCAAGLDALGHAAIAVALGWTPRALVVAVDLPLMAPLLEDFAATGLLAIHGPNDPYSKKAAGFLPGEGVAAITLEAHPKHAAPWCQLTAYAANADAHDAIALPASGQPLAEMIQALAQCLPHGQRFEALCPHATGTAAHRVSEAAALACAFPQTPDASSFPTLHVLKPFTGHTLGASGLLDTALLASSLKSQVLPPNQQGAKPPASGWELPTEARFFPQGASLLKVAAGMGGHNAGVVLRRF